MSFESRSSTMYKNICERAEIAKSRTRATIYRVPKALRMLNESAYTPRVISIGPIHCHNIHLESTGKDIKMNYLKSLLSRVEKAGYYIRSEAEVLTECLTEMNMLLDGAKESYAEQVDGNALNEEMLVIDGCFILELFYRDYCIKNHKQEDKKEIADPTSSDPVYSTDLMPWVVQKDLMLLENQLPFSVLEKLFDLTVKHIQEKSERHLNLGDYVGSFFGSLLDCLGSKPPAKNKKCCWPSLDCVIPIRNTNNSELHQDSSTQQASSTKEVNYHHIVHFLQNHYHQSDQPRWCDEEFKHTASDLKYAGIKFVRGGGGLKVKFNEPQGPFKWFRGARFEIPYLDASDDTEPFFRNLIAFEQCCPAVKNHITWYAAFMDDLIDTAEDVKVLEKDKVISTNCLGTQEQASNIFNKLCQDVVVNEYYFATEYKSATEYSERCFPKHFADLKRLYFSSPWKFVAFIVGFIVFGVSLANSIRDWTRK